MSVKRTRKKKSEKHLAWKILKQPSNQIANSWSELADIAFSITKTAIVAESPTLKIFKNHPMYDVVAGVEPVLDQRYVGYYDKD